MENKCSNKFVLAIIKNKNILASKFLEKILKLKCEKRIKAVITNN